jgi:predicted 2-oxoglutarate/Fe(II)-dependent dioxygenase YbiX
MVFSSPGCAKKEKHSAMMIAEAAHNGFRSGDRAPFSCGLKKDMAFYSFDAQAGRPAAIILAGSLPPSAVASQVSAFEDLAEDFARAEADVLLFVHAQGPHTLDHMASPPAKVQIVYCMAQTFQDWRFDDETPSVVVIDRNARIVAPIRGADPEGVAQAALDCIAPPTGACRDQEAPAPILIIPNVFTADLCKQLIEHFDRNPHIVGSIASRDAQGAAYNKIDEAKKKREDFLLRPGDPYYAPVIEAITRVCVPEIKRAFQFDACYTDRVILACYGEDGGCFLRHRDNAAPAVAYRQFALSINLNTGEYEGGHVVFPEYNSQKYKHGRGAAAVFSTTLLHEATPVLKGRRYVLLTFLHNAEAEARRLAAFSGSQES